APASPPVRARLRALPPPYRNTSRNYPPYSAECSPAQGRFPSNDSPPRAAGIRAGPPNTAPTRAGPPQPAPVSVQEDHHDARSPPRTAERPKRMEHSPAVYPAKPPPAAPHL